MNKQAISILSALAGALAGVGIVGKVSVGRSQRIQSMSDKHLALFLMMNQWVKVKQDGKNLSTYFEKNGYKKVAIYGMSYVGGTLADELKNTNVVVAYGIDKKADSVYSDVDIVSMEDELEAVDAVVVTAITFFDEIEEQLSRKIKCPIISLEDILYEI
ncbi:MAG: hypothetical protein K2N73_15110 [Lachnospiraceae bacterium]|nr:hypothetical protein [Lachnospiraceae bacterium]